MLTLRRRVVWFAVCGWLAASAVTAQESTLKIHPVAGLFGPDQSACVTGAAASSVRIAPALCAQFASIEQRAAWGRQFESLMISRFGDNIRLRLDEALPAGLTREAMLSQTVVASLHLSRADLWAVPKRSVLDVHMPITISLLLTNVLTGEVMMVENYSIDVQGEMTFEGYEARAVEEFPDHLNRAINALVEAAALQFRPNSITGVVRGRAGQRYVLDVGRRGGLREGDQIGADATVVFADANYSIVEPALGSLAVGQALVRQVAQPVDNLARPSMMVVVAQASDGLAAAYLTSRMEDALGDAAGFAVMPVNHSLPLIRDPALTQAGVAGRPRTLPDYFLRLSVAALEPIEADTNVGGVRRRVQEARAFVEVINHEGRVVFAAQGVDRQVDEIVGGMAPSTEQRRDAAVNNAIIRAATQLSTTFQPSPLRLETSPSREEVRITDAGGVLSAGVDLVVVRRVGRMSGITGDVWAPVTSIEVVSSDGAEAVARYAGVETPRIQSGDQVAYEAAGRGTRSRRLFAQCLTDGRPSVSVRGSITQPLFEQIAVNSFAGEFSGAVHIATFDQELRVFGLESQFGGSTDLGVLAPPAADICFEPVHQVTSSGERPDRGQFVVGSYDLTVGYTLRQNGARVGGGGLQAALSASAIPAGSTEQYRDRSLQIDLAEEVTKLARASARQLVPPL
ncbi:hypothetical protein KB221_07405 [Aquidulcibacter paucihalophilus]|nr:hypothetical protein KB221_07405 [Aquidulcibacter paucihalophilus]